MDVDINPKIKMIECKVINGRKIGINVTLEVLMFSSCLPLIQNLPSYFD